MNLKGKVVLITGASSGFGADAAHLFAQEGAIVVLAARRLDRLQELVNKIQDSGGEALAIPVDIAKVDEVHLMVQSTLDFYNHIDVLVNNAGFGKFNWFEKLEYERDIETQIAVNLTGLIEVTHTVLPHMLARRQGHIINMASVSGFTASPLHSIYAATKFGVRGFTTSLRRELQPLGIHVTGIYPGPAKTEFMDDAGEYTALGNLPVPEWIFMESEKVAKKVVQVAKKPRRRAIMPWGFAIIIFLDNFFPHISDWVQSKFSKKYHIL